MRKNISAILFVFFVSLFVAFAQPSNLPVAGFTALEVDTNNIIHAPATTSYNSGPFDFGNRGLTNVPSMTDNNGVPYQKANAGSVFATNAPLYSLIKVITGNYTISAADTNTMSGTNLLFDVISPTNVLLTFPNTFPNTFGVLIDTNISVFYTNGVNTFKVPIGTNNWAYQNSSTNRFIGKVVWFELQSQTNYIVVGERITSGEIDYRISLAGGGNGGTANSTLTNAPIIFTGDATGTGSNTVALTLKNTGTAGTYTKPTFDAQGRETSGTTLSVSDLPTGTVVSNATSGATAGLVPVSAAGSPGWAWQAQAGGSSSIISPQTIVTGNYAMTLTDSNNLFTQIPLFIVTQPNTSSNILFTVLASWTNAFALFNGGTNFPIVLTNGGAAWTFGIPNGTNGFLYQSSMTNRLPGTWTWFRLVGTNCFPQETPTDAKIQALTANNLTTVSHDGTLSGDGAGVPLSVVGGGGGSGITSGQVGVFLPALTLTNTFAGSASTSAKFSYLTNAPAGSTNEITLQNNASSDNVLAFQNLNGNGFSAWTARNNNGVENMAVGHYNGTTGNWSYAGQGLDYIETSYYDGINLTSNSPPPFAIVQTGYIASRNNFLSVIRFLMETNGDMTWFDMNNLPLLKLSAVNDVITNYFATYYQSSVSVAGDISGTRLNLNGATTLTSPVGTTSTLNANGYSILGDGSSFRSLDFSNFSLTLFNSPTNTDFLQLIQTTVGKMRLVSDPTFSKLYLFDTDNGNKLVQSWSRDGTGNSTIGGTLTVSNGITGNLTVSGTVQPTNGIASLSSNTLAPTSISFPASTVNWTNPVTKNIEVIIDNVTVTGTAIKKNGTQISGQTVGTTTLNLQPNEYFSETYTIGSPTATWSPF